MGNKSQTPPYRFCLKQLQIPTYYNLYKYLQKQGWNRTHFNWLAHFSEKNFQFNAEAAECLEFKNLLAELVTHYCPQIMPMTFCIDDQNWQSVLNQIADKFYRDQVENLVWILKPAKLNNGQHIKIIQNLSQLEEHYLSANRLGGEHVLQQYLTSPHLLKGPSQGHKYSIRMFVILTNYDSAFLFPKGYFNIALNPYQSDEFTDLSCHLTNEHLHEDGSNVVQIPTEAYALFKPFYPQIKAIVSETVNGLQQRHPQAFIDDKERRLAIFGFDFMVDVHERVWLIEVNHGPCFPTSEEHPLQKKFYDQFWQAFYKNFVLPIAMRQHPAQIHYQLFERINSVLAN